MRRIVILIGAGLIFIITSAFIVLVLSVRHGVRERTGIAQEKYQGTAEEALLAYLLDTTNSPRDRTDVAIWTLGQIRSQKALPILMDLEASSAGRN
jgi:hypothetical protein